MDRAVGFYRDVLGLSLQFESPEWTELAWRDTTIALHRGRGEGPRGSWLGFQVDDVDAALAAIEAAGGRRGADRFEAGARLVSITDIEGNAVTIGGKPTWA
jgi:predicted enzyme related to lactoylglutathione lyase